MNKANYLKNKDLCRFDFKRSILQMGIKKKVIWKLKQNLDLDARKVISVIWV